MTKKIELPSSKQVNNCLNERDDPAEHDPYEVYIPQRQFLDNWFRKFPKNDNLKEVLTKAYMLDSLYLTRCETKYLDQFADNIIRMEDFDQRLKKCDLELVNEATCVEPSGSKRKNIYSFSTKYCSFHYPEKYPIYDSNVRRTLMHCKREFGFFDFTGEGIKDYPKFYEVLGKFKEIYGLESFSWREIDLYLFLTGKELNKK